MFPNVAFVCSLHGTSILPGEAAVSGLVALLARADGRKELFHGVNTAPENS
jgi:hypothetical protein